MNYRNELIKHQNIQAFKTYLLEFYKDHYIYFVTYTFKNTFNAYNASYKPALTRFFRKLNQACLSRSSQKDISVKLLCIREISHHCKVSNMKKEDHYHCFMMVPKQCQDRFCRLAVKKYENVFYKILEKDVLKIDLNEKIYETCFFKNVHEENPALENYDLDVRFLETSHDILRAYDYATKTICAFPVTFTASELNKFENQSVKRPIYISNDKDDDHFLIFDKVLKERKDHAS